MVFDLFSPAFTPFILHDSRLMVQRTLHLANRNVWSSWFRHFCLHIEFNFKLLRRHFCVLEDICRLFQIERVQPVSCLVDAVVQVIVKRVLVAGRPITRHAKLQKMLYNIKMMELFAQHNGFVDSSIPAKAKVYTLSEEDDMLVKDSTDIMHLKPPPEEFKSQLMIFHNGKSKSSMSLLTEQKSS